MVYRNDIEALAARHADLAAEVAARVRERDAVGFMLLEARSHDAEQLHIADVLADGPRRRRRRRMWIALRRMSIVLAVITVIAGAVFGGRYEYRANREHERHAKFVAAMDAMRMFTNKMCECTTTACVQRVSDDMTKWGQQAAKEIGVDQKPTDDEIKQMTELAMGMAKCMQRAMSPPEQPEQPEQPGN